MDKSNKFKNCIQTNHILSANKGQNILSRSENTLKQIMFYLFAALKFYNQMFVTLILKQVVLI